MAIAAGEKHLVSCKLGRCGELQKVHRRYQQNRHIDAGLQKAKRGGSLVTLGNPQAQCARDEGCTGPPLLQEELFDLGW